MWQDYVLFLAQFGFGLLLLPAITTKGSRIPRTTSIPTAALLALITFTYFSLELYLATITGAFSVLMWVAIAYYRPVVHDSVEVASPTQRRASCCIHRRHPTDYTCCEEGACRTSGCPGAIKPTNQPTTKVAGALT